MRLPAQMQNRELGYGLMLAMAGPRRHVYAHDGIAYEAVEKPHIFANGRVGLHTRFQPLALQNRQFARNR